jgi:hypothetical protein
MTLYGAGSSSVVWWGVEAAPVALAIWALVTGALGLIGIVQLNQIHKLSGPRAARRKFDGALARNIGVVILIYTIAEGISAGALHALRHDALIFPIAVGIAGVHFFVFARVLHTWQYYITGSLDCLAVAITLLLASSDSKVGAVPSWIFYPLVGGGAALFVTAGLMLYESGVILMGLGHTAPAARD